MNFEYSLESERSFDEVVADVEKLTAEKMFRILHIHDVQATLKEKGLERKPLKIIELCNAKFAHEALGKDASVSLFMPCKIIVYTEGGKTRLKAMRPAAIAEFFPEAGLNDLAADVDKIVLEITDRAAQG
ncbi:MAG: DUF302 domain-containing protein [FCB group bacterium]|nr:DUF302 domain-containing protein [FCB group bacterium]